MTDCPSNITRDQYVRSNLKKLSHDIDWIKCVQLEHPFYSLTVITVLVSQRLTTENSNYATVSIQIGFKFFPIHSASSSK